MPLGLPFGEGMTFLFRMLLHSLWNYIKNQQAIIAILRNDESISLRCFVPIRFLTRYLREIH